MRMTAAAAALACVAIAGYVPVNHAQAPDTPAQEHQHGKAQPPGDMAARCQAAMAQHEKRMADMKAADARLDELVTKMNQASGPARVDAVAAALTEMVQQRKTMHGQMMGMHQGMMSHMMEHMQAGPKSMANCPMGKMGGVKP